VEGRQEPIEAALHIVKMHAFGPPNAYFLLHGSAGELEPWPIEIVAKAIGSGHPDQHGRRIGHSLEPGLAFPQPFFRKFPLCDIAVYGVIDDVLARTPGDRDGEKGYVNLAPILALTYGFDLNSPDLFELICVFSGAPYKGLGDDELINRVPHKVLRPVTEQAREFPIGAKNATVCA
jgi:hypothetical protein